MIGNNKVELDTPALWVDLDLMEENIRRLSAFCVEHDLEWRPHTKGLKVPAVVHKAMAASAIGATCAKVSEAEVMAAAGIRDILIANQVVGAQKIRRLMRLRRQADVMVAVDDASNVRELGKAARAWGLELRVLVEVDIGLHRCGMQPGQPVVGLALLIHETQGLKLQGVMAWEGHTVGIMDADEKREMISQSIGKAVHSAELCRAAGLPMDIVSCGGSATYTYTGRVRGVTELQAGGGIFCDTLYRHRGVPLQPALFVQTLVMSHTSSDQAVADAGFKTIGTSSLLPEVVGRTDLEVFSLHAEHSLLRLHDGAGPLHLGDKIDLIVPHVDRTVCLHDRLYGVRGGIVETVWDIQGRGKLQ